MRKVNGTRSKLTWCMAPTNFEIFLLKSFYVAAAKRLRISSYDVYQKHVQSWDKFTQKWIFSIIDKIGVSMVFLRKKLWSSS